jgi:hypothetical protein
MTAASQNVALIDFEFTGLDSEFITTNEIVQVKVKHFGTGKSFLRNFRSEQTITAHVRLSHKVERYPGHKFSSKALKSVLAKTGCDANTVFWGWSISEDVKMLKKYGIEMKISDIQERLRLTDEYEARMAVEGAGLEAVYFLATGGVVKIDHASKDELDVIHKLYEVATALTPRERLTIMPYGFARGMKIRDYVVSHRRQADGYRFNNSDLLAASLTAAIPGREYHYHDDEDEFDEDYDEDEDDESEEDV